MAARTYLFVPGDSEHKLAWAHEREAGAIIADLEDAVATNAKAAARRAVADWLTNSRGLDLERWVRINPEPMLDIDIKVLAGHSLTGVMVPKVSNADDVGATVSALDRAGLTGAVVIPIIETAAALTNLNAIAGAPRVHQLMLGDIDLGAELGIAPGSPAWAPIRVQIVVASAAAGLPGPLGPVNPDFLNLDRLRDETRLLYEMGYRSRVAIHPDQVPVFHESLSPTDDEIAWARSITASLDASTGVGVDAAGRMIDEAVAKQARRILNDAGIDSPGS